MKIMKTLVVSVLALSLVFSATFPAEAKTKRILFKIDMYQDMFLYFADSHNKTVRLSWQKTKKCGGRICGQYYYSKPYKKLTIQLKSGKKAKIKNGLLYSTKGKLLTGTITTKLTREDEWDNVSYKIKVKKGKIITGTEYEWYKP